MHQNASPIDSIALLKNHNCKTRSNSCPRFLPFVLLLHPGKTYQYSGPSAEITLNMLIGANELFVIFKNKYLAILKESTITKAKLYKELSLFC
jgi:hypothetical protein